MREIRTSGLMSGEGKRSFGQWLAPPRPSSNSTGEGPQSACPRRRRRLALARGCPLRGHAGSRRRNSRSRQDSQIRQRFPWLKLVWPTPATMPVIPRLDDRNRSSPYGRSANARPRRCAGLSAMSRAQIELASGQRRRRQIAGAPARNRQAHGRQERLRRAAPVDGWSSEPSRGSTAIVGSPRTMRTPPKPSQLSYQRWLREPGQSVKWIFCLRAARVLVADQEQR